MSGSGGAARAARAFASSFLGAETMHNFEQSRLGGIRLEVIFGEVGFSVLHSKGSTTSIARAAGAITRSTAELGLPSKTRLLAGELTFGFGAKSGRLALPSALGLLTER